MAGGGLIGFAIGAVAVGAVWLMSRRAAAAMPDSPLGELPLLPGDYRELTTAARKLRVGGEAASDSGRHAQQGMSHNHSRALNK